MLKDEKQMLWKLSAALVGASMPLVLLGPAVMAIVLILGIIAGLFATKGNSLRSTLKYIATSRIIYILAVLFAALGLSAYLSVDQAASMAKMGDLMGMGGLALLLYISLREMPTKYTDIIYRSLTVSVFVVASLCLLDAFTDSNRLTLALHGNNNFDVARLEKMSSVFAVLLPFVWAWLFRRFREGEVMVKWFAVPIAIVSLLAIFVSGGYVGWVATAVALFIFLYYAWKYHNMKFEVKPVLFTVFLVLFGLLCFGWSRGFNQPEDFASILNAAEFTPRVDLWTVAWAHIFDKPFTGIGLATFNTLSDANGVMVSSSHPNNFLLQLFLETGFIGGFIALALCVVMIRYFMRASHSNLYGVAGLASISAFFVAALTQTSIFHPWWLTMLIFSGVLAARVGWAVERK